MHRIKFSEVWDKLKLGWAVRRLEWAGSGREITMDNLLSHTLTGYDLSADDWVGYDVRKMVQLKEGLSFFEAVSELYDCELSEMCRAAWGNKSMIASTNGQLHWVEDHLENVSLSFESINAMDWTIWGFKEN